MNEQKIKIKMLLCASDYFVSKDMKEEHYVIYQALPLGHKFKKIKDIFAKDEDEIITFDELSRRIKRYLHGNNISS